MSDPDHIYVPVALDATIASGASQSGAIDIAGVYVVRVFVPSTGWPTAGANLTILESLDGTNYYPLREDSGSETTLAIGALAAARFVRVRNKLLDGSRWIKLRCGTAATPVNVPADCAIKVIVRPA